jgi:hypothetical protein
MVAVVAAARVHVSAVLVAVAARSLFSSETIVIKSRQV